MASRGAEDRTGQERFVTQTNEIRNLQNNDVIHHEILTIRCFDVFELLNFPC